MKLEKFIADVQARGGVTKAFQLILLTSLLTNILLAGTFFSMDKSVRTILVPTEITKTFWVDGHNLSPEYLEQMGVWVIQQYATVTPSSVDYQTGQLMKYVHPSVHGELLKRFQLSAKNMKANNISKVFMPREVRVSQEGRAVALIGTLGTWIADKRINDEQKAFKVVFDYDGSKMFIKELKETNLKEPFDDSYNEPIDNNEDAEVEAM